LSLSASTLLFFVLLIPGIVFRFFLYSETIVKRSLNSSNTLYVSVMVVLYALACQIGTMLLYNLISRIVLRDSKFDISVKLVEVDGKVKFFANAETNGYFGFIDKHPFIVGCYSIGTLVFAICLAKLVLVIAQRWHPLGRVLYGPLAPLVSGKYVELFVCHVLTKIRKGDQLVMYSGFPIEVNLVDGSRIDHIIIKNPEKFYLCLGDEVPKTTRGNSRKMSGSDALLYISGDEIENVHFATWLFADKGDRDASDA